MNTADSMINSAPNSDAGRARRNGVPEDRHATRHLAFLLVPTFSMMAFTSAIEPLRVANRLSGRPLYRWSTLALPGTLAMASNGMVLDAGSVLPDDPDALFVCAAFDPETAFRPEIRSLLRRLDRASVPLGGLDTGSFVLAWAGLLDGRRATAHWESLDSFRERFPRVDARPVLFEIDRNRLTCAGGTAALDMMLHLIRLDHGHQLAAAVAEQFIHPAIRAADAAQRMPVALRFGVGHSRLAAVIRLIERSLEEPLDLGTLAARAGLSQRQLERLFRAHLGVAPKAYYLGLRLERARSLVHYSTLRLAEIAAASGFASYAHFSRSYRARFGRAPRADRPGPHHPAAGMGPMVRLPGGG